MRGHIWIESEGIDKGTNATFIVRVGICHASGDPSTQQAASKGRGNHASADFIGHKPLFRDNDGMVLANPRYQRSV